MAATVLNNHQRAQKLVQRVKEQFKNIPRTRYWMRVVYYDPFDGYNIFFNIQKKHMFSRSIPVAEYRHFAFKDLLVVLKEFRQTYQFTIDFVGFSKEELRQLYEERII